MCCMFPGCDLNCRIYSGTQTPDEYCSVAGKCSSTNCMGIYGLSDTNICVGKYNIINTPLNAE